MYIMSIRGARYTRVPSAGLVVAAFLSCIVVRSAVAVAPRVCDRLVVAAFLPCIVARSAVYTV